MFQYPRHRRHFPRDSGGPDDAGHRGAMFTLTYLSVTFPHTTASARIRDGCVGDHRIPSNIRPRVAAIPQGEVGRFRVAPRRRSQRNAAATPGAPPARRPIQIAGVLVVGHALISPEAIWKIICLMSLPSNRANRYGRIISGCPSAHAANSLRLPPGFSTWRLQPRRRCPRPSSRSITQSLNSTRNSSGMIWRTSSTAVRTASTVFLNDSPLRALCSSR